jgi:hypothetical protein
MKTLGMVVCQRPSQFLTAELTVFQQLRTFSSSSTIKPEEAWLDVSLLGEQPTKVCPRCSTKL